MLTVQLPRQDSYDTQGDIQALRAATVAFTDMMSEVDAMGVGCQDS